MMTRMDDLGQEIGFVPIDVKYCKPLHKCFSPVRKDIYYERDETL